VGFGSQSALGWFFGGDRLTLTVICGPRGVNQKRARPPTLVAPTLRGGEVVALTLRGGEVEQL
jgi:hypothetical protein